MIYFDHASSTPPFTEALRIFNDYSLKEYANPSSSHAFGRKAARLLEKSRNDILDAFSLKSSQYNLVFLSGASEANNLALKGIASSYQNRGKRILVSRVEHPSVIEPAKQLKKLGYDVIFLPVNHDGIITPKTLEKFMSDQTILVSVMAVNNETGSINPLKEISAVIKRYPKCFLHVDATQAIGKEIVSYDQIDLFSFSAHKFGGLKGSGALVYQKRISLEPLIAGGGQESGFRSGTSSLPLYASMAFALTKAMSDQASARKKVLAIRQYLLSELEKTNEVSFNSPLNASPFILNFSLKRKKASVLVEAFSRKEIYLSSVSACSSKGEPISEVLLAMGKSKEDASNSIRLSFSENNSQSEAKTFVDEFSCVIKELVDR